MKKKNLKSKLDLKKITISNLDKIKGKGPILAEGGTHYHFCEPPKLTEWCTFTCPQQ